MLSFKSKIPHFVSLNAGQSCRRQLAYLAESSSAHVLCLLGFVVELSVASVRIMHSSKGRGIYTKYTYQKRKIIALHRGEKVRKGSVTMEV